MRIELLAEDNDLADLIRVVERIATDAESTSEVQIWITDAVAL
jgi:hypothetical protein